MKTKRINIGIKIEDFGQQKTLNLLLNNLIAREICLLFVLLREDLSDSLEIRLDNFTMFLKLTKTNVSTYSLFDLKGKVFKGAISMNALEYILHYLLKYYRDEVGEAEHIDVDFECTDRNIVTLTLKVDSFKEYSKEEINKLLGI